jgi:hypothetical protein
MIKHFPIIFSIITTSIGGIVLANLEPIKSQESTKLPSPEVIIGAKETEEGLCQVEYFDSNGTIQVTELACLLLD